MSLESLSKISELTGMAPRTIKARLARLNPLVEGRVLRYETKEALPLIYRVGIDAEALNPAVERALLDRERRKALELANGKLEGSLLPADQVAETWTRLVGVAKGRFLALPARVSSELLRLKTHREIESTLRAALIVILEELSSGEAEDPNPPGQDAS